MLYAIINVAEAKCTKPAWIMKWYSKEIIFCKPNDFDRRCFNLKYFTKDYQFISFISKYHIYNIWRPTKGPPWPTKPRGFSGRTTSLPRYFFPDHRTFLWTFLYLNSNSSVEPPFPADSYFQLSFSNRFHWLCKLFMANKIFQAGIIV